MTYAPVQAPETVQYVKAPSNGLATAGLVLGIIGVVLALIPVLGIAGALIGGIGLILSVFGFLASRKHGAGKGKSIAGLILGVASIVVFMIVSAATVAAVDSVVEEMDKAVAEGSDKSADSDTSGDAGATASDNGGALTVGNWKVVGKIAPEADFIGDFQATFRVKNTSDAEDTGIFTVNVLKGNKIMASMDCTSSPAAPGAIATVDCMSTDKFKRGWSEVTIENSF